MVAGMLVLSIMGMADCQLPEVGDTVVVATEYTGLCTLLMVGNITDMDDTTISLNVSMSQLQMTTGSPQAGEVDDLIGRNVSIGKSSYIYMVKIDPEELD